MNNGFSRRVVLGGISTALIILSLYGGMLIRTNKLTFMILATLVSSLPYIRGNISTGVLCYASAALLGWLVLPNKLYAFVYALFGIYPFIKLKSEKYKVVLEFIIKYIWYNASLIVYYIFFKNFIVVNSFFLSTQGMIILVIAAEGMFLVYDYIFTRFIMFVQDRVFRNK